MFESKCEHMKIIRTREFGKEFRSLFREACTLTEKIGLVLEVRDSRIWLEYEAQQGNW